MRRAKKVLGIMTAVIAVLFLSDMKAEAAQKQTVYNSPYVTFAPDGKAWTTNAGERNMEWYAKGTAVSTGIASNVRELQEGEHYYSYARVGEIPIGRWQVEYSSVNCCHSGYPSAQVREFHGMSFVQNNCLKKHYSGWMSYCADCDDLIAWGNIYMSRDTAETIDYLEVGTGMDYYYSCPFCNSLEQGIGLEGHRCKAISGNQYKVKYCANAGQLYGGYMSDSFHMYDNASKYEGQEITPVTHLSKNTYIRTGYEFVGWNTKPDGSGSSFADEAEILNLTSKDWKQDGEQGEIVLYAQWREASGVLKIDPNGGSYRNAGSVTEIEGEYGSSYNMDTDMPVAPKGYTVSFATNGGTNVAPVTSEGCFVEWMMEQPFQGTFRDGKYYFDGPDGNVDTLTAKYQWDAVMLPVCERENWSFGGWYYDSECTQPAGVSGDFITLTKDITLYAGWVDLKLSAKDNYAASDGKGAVDLEWSQQDKNKKVYKVYQSKDNRSWELVTSSKDIGNKTTVAQSFSYSGSSKTYTAPYSGVYTLTARGARGGDYGSYKGGYGGSVTAKVWLQEGETITYTVGGQDGYNGGGAGTVYANGGGATTVVSDRQGTLLIAGGGGGASASGNGGNGGSQASLRMDKSTAGSTGQTGGGAGYIGGNSGEYVVHNHVEPAVGGTSACRHIHGSGCYIYHVHSGSIESGGACYILDHKEYDHNSWCCGYCTYWGGTYMGSLGYCLRCGNGGIGPLVKYIYVLNCGMSESTVIGYRCGRNENYICGYSQGQIVSSKPAYGGSNYVNTAVAYTYSQEVGACAGDGSFTISSEAVGYLEQLFLNEVPSGDCEVPERIEESSVQKEMLGGEKVRFSWQEPADKGTEYYHVVESYHEGSADVLCRSNVTRNTLVSGVKGYYYLIDSNPTTVVNAGNSHFCEEASLTVAVGEQVEYLHVAAVDKAGNVGDALHVRMQADKMNWKLYTDQLFVDEGDNVYPGETSGIWYVCADGSTPFTLRYQAYMDGIASLEYQPNFMIFETVTEGVSARNAIYTPSSEITNAMIRTEASNLSYSVEGASPLVLYPYSYTLRTDHNRSLSGVQSFTISPEEAGKQIKVIPIAGADKGKETLYSDYDADQKNGITIIGDGEGPVISGLDVLEYRDLINRNESSISLTVTATDELSGMKEFYVEITNTDNAGSAKYMPDEQGMIRINITQEDAIFTGDFVVRAWATDYVGNETELTYATTEFALSATVERILAPHTPVFKCGESGILTIATYGYAERVEIIFPPEMTALQPELNQVFDYSGREAYVQQETLQFMIPLQTPTDTQYTITVRAYKGDKRLEEAPTLSTVAVTGSVLDELRTRLR